jgi:hypothetical protein
MLTVVGGSKGGLIKHWVETFTIELTLNLS